MKLTQLWLLPFATLKNTFVSKELKAINTKDDLE